MILLRNADIMQVLDMPITIESLRAGYDDLRRGDAAYVPRIDLWSPTGGDDDDYYQSGSMSGVCRSYGVAAVRIKSAVLKWLDDGTVERFCREPGTHMGIILLFATRDGVPLGILQDGYLQHMRVGGAAGIGADLLARADADTVGMVGSGGMAETYLRALAEVRPLRSARVFSPTRDNREAFAARMSSELRIDVQAVDTPEQAVRNAAIVATATDATGPTFDADWVAPGAHVTCVTRRELGPPLLERSDRIVQLGVNSIPYGADVPDMEWRAGANAAYVTGQPEERARIPSGRADERGAYPTLLDVETGRAPGRTDESEITLFITTGTQGLQFASVAGRTFQLAVDAGLGQHFPTDWFLQDIRS